MTMPDFFGKPLAAAPTAIPGLVLWDLPVHGDSRGWFKENWQRAKMVDAGLPDFGPVQNNISFNDAVGTTRGIHAEPWDKWVSIATGRVFGAWVDLRDGPHFGTVVTAELDPSRAVFVPRGVGNAYQTLVENTAYTYLVNDHWTPDADYTFLDLADETIAVPWPIPLGSAEVSTKDQTHPPLADVQPIGPRATLVIGADGQVGRALRAAFGARAPVEFATRHDLDLTSPDLVTARRWRDYDTIINVAAYTGVDAAESAAGRTTAWAVNVGGVAALARVATEHGLTLVHLSSDYVFDGSGDRPYRETDPVSPLGVYGQTKAAGDAAVALVPRHYIVRTSWVIGDGPNFVRTMLRLERDGIDPRVVDDQIGRLSFATDIARGILHLLQTDAAPGVYNLTSSGAPQSWADIARVVFDTVSGGGDRVSATTTAEYATAAPGPTSPRPRNSVLDLSKITAAGFEPGDMRVGLDAYLTDELGR